MNLCLLLDKYKNEESVTHDDIVVSEYPIPGALDQIDMTWNFINVSVDTVEVAFNSILPSIDIVVLAKYVILWAFNYIGGLWSRLGANGKWFPLSFYSFLCVWGFLGLRGFSLGRGLGCRREWASYSGRRGSFDTDKWKRSCKCLSYWTTIRLSWSRLGDAVVDFFWLLNGFYHLFWLSVSSVFSRSSVQDGKEKESQDNSSHFKLFYQRKTEEL